ncbi:MAG: winged helix-turn-helix transcriptional regulator [Chloroflexi bacterium]|nr:winged helix-turn-helix transcriptional regulator [Chloroflexota bacterium]
MIELSVLGANGSAARLDVTESAARLLKLLADPTRRRVFLKLTEGEICNCELADGLGLAQNLVSHHIRQLREAGFVRERRDANDARWIYYWLDKDALGEAWRSLDASINPAHIGQRTPVCPPPEANA